MDLRPTSNAAAATKIWQPGGLFSGGRLAALLLSQRALRLSSFVAPCQSPARKQRAHFLFMRWVQWILRVRDALNTTYSAYPFMAYGTDWLAFGHFVIAIAFVGALRDPVRNRWLYLFGMISCVLVISYAAVCGAMRGIPFYWRLIDCSFGVFGFVPLWFCWRWTGTVEDART